MKSSPTIAKNFPKIATKPPTRSTLPHKKTRASPKYPPTDRSPPKKKLVKPDSHQQKINAQDASQDPKRRKPQELTTS